MEPGHRQADRLIAALAASQYGVVTRQQALELGATVKGIRHRLERGRWHAILPGIYVVTGYPSWRQTLMAGCLWTSGVASHLSAAGLWGFDGFGEGPIEITTTRRLRKRDGLLVYQVGHILRADCTKRASIPVTTPTRTLADLAGSVDRDLLEDALESALRQQQTSVPTLIRAVDRLGARRGIRDLKRLLDARPPGTPVTDSRLEVRLERALIAAGLPRPVRQFPVVGPEGLVGRVDFAYPERRLAIECDSYTFHGGRRAWKRDRSRLNALTRLDWKVLFVTWEDVARGAGEVVEAVREHLYAETAKEPVARATFEDRGPLL